MVKNQSELVDFVKERLLESDDRVPAIWQYLVQEGYPEEIVNRAVVEGYRSVPRGIFPKLKISPFYLDDHHEIKVFRTIEMGGSEGHVGLAKLIYTGHNPFSRRKIEGFSLHDNEGEMRRFVYLSYFKKKLRSSLPWKNAPDYCYEHAKGDLDKVLKRMKKMYDDPESGDFKYVLEKSMWIGGHCLKEMLGRISETYQGPFIIRNSNDNFLTTERDHRFRRMP